MQRQQVRRKEAPTAAITVVSVLSVLLILSSSTPSCIAFQVPTSSRSRCSNNSKSSLTKSTTTLNVLPVDAIDMLVTTTAAAAAAHHVNSLFVTDFFQTISNAAVATADGSVEGVAAAAAASDDGGWWGAYLNLFKSALLLVHDTIDGPLRSVGWTQTWGVSIFLFTAGT
jgi:hypothetical protein